MDLEIASPDVLGTGEHGCMGNQRAWIYIESTSLSRWVIRELGYIKNGGGGNMFNIVLAEACRFKL